MLQPRCFWIGVLIHYLPSDPSFSHQFFWETFSWIAHRDILCPLLDSVILVSFSSFLLDLFFLFTIDIISSISVNILSEIWIIQVLILIYFYSPEIKMPNEKFLIVNSRLYNAVYIKMFKQFLVVKLYVLGRCINWYGF